MAEDIIRYDVLVQDALRGIVRKVLSEVAHTGLPGDHHFYIAFDTSAPGVRIPSRVKQSYPDEMTIVIQHQFWNLAVTDQFFEVKLSFNGVAEKLHIPFSAIKGFFDPSVQFSLQFEPALEEEAVGLAESDEPAMPNLKSVGAAEPDASSSKQSVAEAEDEAAPADESEAEKPDANDAETAPANGDEAGDGGAEVVSLDAFRKKT